jgi:hypothetical protein
MVRFVRSTTQKEKWISRSPVASSELQLMGFFGRRLWWNAGRLPKERQATVSTNRDLPGGRRYRRAGSGQSNWLHMLRNTE